MLVGCKKRASYVPVSRPTVLPYVNESVSGPHCLTQWLGNMKLTQFTNFAIRILIYTGLKRTSPSSLPEIAKAYGISHDHIKKVALELIRLGVLQSVRGRNGGVQLSCSPETLVIGDLVGKLENTQSFVECFDEANNTCPLIEHCVFRKALQRAVRAFYEELDKYTLADLIRNRDPLSESLRIDCGR